MDVARSLTGKVAIVTGSSSGFGAAIAILFSKLGVRVCVHGRQENSLQLVSDQCKDASPEKIQPLMVVGDINDKIIREKLVNMTVAHFGKLDILINNAGVFALTDVENITLEELDSILNTNVRAPFDLVRIATPKLAETKGCIVNVSSIASFRACAQTTSYNISKAALDQFTKCFSLALIEKGIRMNSVNPGWIPTNLGRASGITHEASAKMVEEKGLPKGSPEDIAKVVAFIASDNASFMNGSITVVDGGAHNQFMKI